MEGAIQAGGGEGMADGWHMSSMEAQTCAPVQAMPRLVRLLHPAPRLFSPPPTPPLLPRGRVSDDAGGPPTLVFNDRVNHSPFPIGSGYKKTPPTWVGNRDWTQHRKKRTQQKHRTRAERKERNRGPAWKKGKKRSCTHEDIR